MKAWPKGEVSGRVKSKVERNRAMIEDFYERKCSDKTILDAIAVLESGELLVDESDKCVKKMMGGSKGRIY